MSAAHELVARGFSVTVLERNAIPGGKARSIPARIDGLPGEHGFRFFPSFYRHLTDTMRRIPFGAGGRNVLGNLVDTAHTGTARFGRDIRIFAGGFPDSPAGFIDMADDLFGNPFGLTPQETRFFAERLMQVATSCDQRRLAQYEGLRWWDFIGAPRFSANYRSVFGATTRSLVAADPVRASVRTIGDITLQAVLGLSTPGEVYDRVLDGPTSAQWIEPWLAHLEARGVRYRRECEITAIDCDAHGIRGVRFDCRGQAETASADWYVAALPVERMAPLITPQIIALDRGLARIPELAPFVGWMNGIQFYLTRELPIVRGHVLYLDTPWALTSISQAQFWPGVDWSRYGDGRIRDCLSVDVSDWFTPGLWGKPARRCTREQIRREVWRQLQLSLNVGGVLRLTDDLYHSHFLDPGIEFDRTTREVSFNREPLLINEVGTWALRPDAVTGIRNLFLAADYVRTHTDLACMEGANEAARRAVNGLLAASRSTAPACGVWPLPIPELLKIWRARDRERYEDGLPWEAALFA